MTQKLEFLTRLLPFIEPRLNLIELAPKGTGKSYVFGNLSKFVWLVSGGKVSRAKLVYDKSTKAPGIMRFYDMVAFDEIQTITFSDNTEMQSFLKNYLEFGKATIDNYEFMSECGLMLLGNILLSENNEPLSYKYFSKDQKLLIDSIMKGYPLPNFFIYKKENETYDMVDGQQRATTISKYVKGEFADSDKHYFKDIDQDRFMSYVLNVTEVYDIDLANGESLEDFYSLVNKRGVHLNPAEVNKAQYHDAPFMILVQIKRIINSR